MAIAATAPPSLLIRNYSTRVRHRCFDFSASSSSSSISSLSASPLSPSSSSGFSNSPGLSTGSAISFQIKAMDIPQGNEVGSRASTKYEYGPDHLLVLVHGIMARFDSMLDLGSEYRSVKRADGITQRDKSMKLCQESPDDWMYAEAELKRQLGTNFLIYVSSSNTFLKTFNGIDGAGRRLADEVSQVVEKTKSLKKISFLAHSLGGLFARYAIGVLYTPRARDRCSQDDPGTIASLEPISFITLATPHLGVRGRKQLPFLLGVPLLEKLAPPIAPFVVGRTGRQLFVADGKSSQPLLLRMAADAEHKFISALGAFKFRTLYANVSFDHMVGWRTSSIRRETELVKPPQKSFEGYKHIIDVEDCPPVSSENPHFTPEAARTKVAAQVSPSQENTKEYHDIMEEEMIHGLQRVGWKKVDVSFHSALWPFFAHNNIHVKNEWLYNAGAGIIAHVADSLKQQDSQALLAANL